jgi:hypothetical protein
LASLPPENFGDSGSRGRQVRQTGERFSVFGERFKGAALSQENLGNVEEKNEWQRDQQGLGSKPKREKQEGQRGCREQQTNDPNWTPGS